jgi:predicted flavoprotein YhiN
VFKWNGKSWGQLGSTIDGESKLDQFGFSVLLSSEGRIMAAGAPTSIPVGGDRCGFMGKDRVVQWNGASWGQLGSNIDGEEFPDQSGLSVSLSNDGSIVAIGSPLHSNGAGHVRVFQWNESR